MRLSEVSFFKLFFFITLIILSACLSRSKNDGKEVPVVISSKDSSGPQESDVVADSLPTTTLLWLDSTFKDYGKLAENDSLSASFRFKNTGDKPLMVMGVKASCGCIVADTVNKPVAPGAISKIKVKFFSQNQPVATHVKQVYVLTNTLPYNVTTLNFKVEVVEDKKRIRAGL